MDSRLTPQLHQELHNVQMEVKQVQFIQASHAERLMRLERRQTEDAVKSVWNPSPFPSVLGGTPQHGPVQMPNNEVFDDFDDEQGQNLLGSLHLDADEEPTRRGAASRANSVRFDEATLHSSNWGQSARHSGEFGPVRPGSGLGGPTLMERTYSHKSDGRHSSAGHSVHSFHSVASGRTSSLGLDLLLGSSRDDDDDDSSPIEITRPPPGLMFLGPVPSIVRCWLTTQYAHDTLQYAVVCTGSQKSTLDYSLLQELGLVGEVHRNINGVLHARLPVYFAEATVAQSSSRSSSPSRRQVPYINVDFEITGENAEAGEQKQGIRIFVGSDTLTANSADLLLSQNRMTLFGNGDDRDRLSVPFVRPEDEASYKHITTLNVVPEKPKLNASAPAFVSGDARPQMAAVPDQAETSASQTDVGESEVTSPFSSGTNQQGYSSKNTVTSVQSDSGSERQQQRGTAPGVEGGDNESNGKENTAGSDAGGTTRRDSTAGIWGSWRTGGSASGGGEAGAQRGENGLSGYQPAGRGGRNMKILKPQKSVSISSSAAGAATRSSNGTGGGGGGFDAPTAARSSGEFGRRKSQGAASAFDQNGGFSSSPAVPAPVRWDNVRRSVSAATPGSSSTLVSGGAPPPPTPTSTASAAAAAADNKPKAPATRSNPVGGASAFSWMAGGGAGGGKGMEKPKTPATPV